MSRSQLLDFNNDSRNNRRMSSDQDFKDQIEFRRLGPHDKLAFFCAIERFPNDSNFTFVSPRVYDGSQDFTHVLRSLDDNEHNRNLPKNFVPDTIFFAFNRDGEIVGRSSIRHHLNDFLIQIGGHIGYGVVPQFRRRGYASQMMVHSLEYARSIGLDRVLVTCDDTNTASIRTIEKFGARLENVISHPTHPLPKRRYWIDLK